MATVVPKSYFVAKNILIFLDAFIAIMIIVASQKILGTPFGKASVSFGLVMMGIVTVLKVLDKF